MFSGLYGLIVKARNALYETGALKSFALGAPTVSIGNLTVGGTGKTPLVAFAAEVLSENGERVCVLSRGYKRSNPKERVLVSDSEKILTDARRAGDEPFELAQKLLGKAFVIADANRFEAAIWAREKFAITAFVLDDGFQHRRVKRDLDIVAVDATNPFGNGKLLPGGVLRESLENLKRADAIIITRRNLVAENQIADLKNEILKYNSHSPIFACANKIADLLDLNFETAKDKEQLLKNKTFAFCGLGNSENFFEQLRRENFNLAGTMKFSDHYFYTQNDVEKIEREARRKGAEILLATAKDAVKLRNARFNLPCFVVENRLIFDYEAAFRELIFSIAAENPKKQGGK